MHLLSNLRMVSCCLTLGLVVSFYNQALGSGGGSTIPLSTTSNELVKMKKSGVMRVAYTTQETPPFIYQLNGIKAGLDVELAESMAEKLGVRLEWVASGPTFRDVFDSLKKGKADLALSALYPTLDRLSDALFSRSYIQVKQILFVNRSRSATQKFSNRYEDLISRPELEFGFYPSAGFVDGLLKHSIPAKWLAYENVADGKSARERMIADFFKGKLAAVWIDELELAKWRKQKSDIDLYGLIVEVPQSEVSISVAVRTESWDLLEWVNLFIDNSKRGDTLVRLYQKHLAIQSKGAQK